MRFILRCAAILGGSELLDALVGQAGLILMHQSILALLLVVWAAYIPEIEKRLIK